MRVLRDVVFLSAIVFLVGVILLLVSHLAQPEEDALRPEITRDFGIILCSIGLISILYETLIRRQLISDYMDALRKIVDPDTAQLGIEALFRDRDDKTNRGRSIDALLRSAESEVFGLGLGFYQLLPEKRELLKAKLRDGCSFRFLIYDATSAQAPALDASLGYGTGTLVTFLAAQHQYFRQFQQEVESEDLPAGAFQARCYSVVPTFGALHIDPKQAGGRLVVELYGRRTEGADCPGVELSERERGWYGFFAQQMERLWQDSRPLSP